MRWLRVLVLNIRRALKPPQPPARPRLTLLRNDFEVGFHPTSTREALMEYAAEHGHAFVDLDRVHIDPKTASMISGKIAAQHSVLPVKVVGDTLYLATNDPANMEVFEAISAATRKRVIPVLTTRESIVETIARLYPEK